MKIKLFNLQPLEFFSRYAAHFYTNMQYSKSTKYIQYKFYFNISSFFGCEECCGLGWVYISRRPSFAKIFNALYFQYEKGKFLREPFQLDHGCFPFVTSVVATSHDVVCEWCWVTYFLPSITTAAVYS